MNEAPRKIERWRKTGRLCSSQDRGFPQNLPEENQEAPQGKTLISAQELVRRECSLGNYPRPLLPRRRPDRDRKVRAKCRQRFCRRNAIGGTRVLVVHGTAIHAFNHIRLLARERDQPLDVIGSAA
jgi:hypothetical protein